MADTAYTDGRAPRQSSSLGVRILAALVVVAVVAAGVWLAGAVVSDDMNVAMGITAVWFGVAGLACFLIARSRRDLMLPVLGAYAVAAVAIGGWLGYSSLVDQEVNETVAVGAPASGAEAAPSEAAPSDGAPAEAAPAPAGNVQLASGEFSAAAHPTSGKAAVVKLAEGGSVLTLTDFETDPGPDLRVYLATDADATDFKDLGPLKGNVGNQQYELPEGIDLDKYSTVVIWCRAFTVGFGQAPLSES